MNEMGKPDNINGLISYIYSRRHANLPRQKLGRIGETLGKLQPRGDSNREGIFLGS